MENSNVKPFSGQFAPRRSFSRGKGKPSRSKNYLELLAHYGAELVETGGLIRIVRCETGVELPMEQKGKLQMVKLLLDEFATVDGTNKAIVSYKTSHS